MTVEVLSFGCRLNIAESPTIALAVAGVGATTVINGCAVTGEAMRQTAQAARRARRSRPDARIVVTGCAAQVDAARFAAMPEVDQVLGNREKLIARSYSGPRIDVGDIFEHRAPALPVVSGTHRTRAFVEVQNGCDHRCTFCIIPFARGDSRSVATGAVVEAIAAAVDGGQREVVLTGVDLTSVRPSLATLVTAILREVPALPRLRLSSLDPGEVDATLFELLTCEPRVMPHVHLSLQAGDDLTLKRMKRRHSAAQAIDLARRLRAARPEIAIGADVIAGFPTEDATMADRTRATMDAMDVVFAHVFPYSSRSRTPAARMPQVDPDTARQRARRLREDADARRAAWLATLVGTVQAVLVERSGRSGHAPNFASVDLAADFPPGTVVAARVSSAANGRLQADAT